MTHNYDEMFREFENQLAAHVSSQLHEIASKLKCSHPTLQNVIRQQTSLSFRAYKNKILFERALQLRKEGHSAKEIAIELGYTHPEHYSRFMNKMSRR
jgi:AraC-like DNA-binding protein